MKRSFKIHNAKRYIAYVHSITIPCGEHTLGRPTHGCVDNKMTVFVPLNYIDERFELIQRVYFHRFNATEQYNGLMQYISDFLYVQYGIDHERTIYEEPVAYQLYDLGITKLPTLSVKRKQKVEFVKFTEYFEGYDIEMVNIDDREYIIKSPMAGDTNIPPLFQFDERHGKNKIRFHYGYNTLMDE